MTLPEDAHLLRIFIGESDKCMGKPLYEWIVVQAHNQRLAGTTVLRGIMGFGANSQAIQTFKIERLSQDLPVVIEIVDSQDKLENFLSSINDKIQAGLVTLEKVRVCIYRSGISNHR
jgi:uncharacterized protein